MRQLLAAFLTTMFFLGAGSFSFALDLDLDKLPGKAEEAKKEASDQAKDMAGKSDDASKKQGMMGDIKAKGKEIINKKVDEVQSNMIGN